MIPADFIQSLLSRVDIVEVITQQVPLKKAGANYSACCPFHGEKTPSFTVSPTKQFYHCFGCGAHGTALSFLIEYQGLSFIEAIKDLAGQVGMVVPDSAPNDKKNDDPTNSEISFQAIHETLRTAMHFFRKQLKESPRAIAYLKQRGISGEIAAKFGLGYAPDGWQSLQEDFTDYKSLPLLKAGLVIDNAEGRRYDRFRDRIMFPIIDPKNNVIGFGGRVLDTGEPKYLNSPETPVFEKGRELYGLFQARRAIREGGKVIVVEGYMDVVALAQHGIENAVATLGTSTTNVHIQKLLRQTDHIIFSFDGDKAGRAAAWRALENSLSELVDRKQISFLFLPDGHDPDSFVREYGQSDFIKMINDAPPLSEFFLRELQSNVNIQNQEGRSQLIENAKPLIQKIQAPMLALHLRKRLSEIAGLSQAELDTQYGIQPKRRLGKVQITKKPQGLSLARRLLKCLIAEPSFALELEDILIEEPTREADALPEIINFIKNAPHQMSSGILIYAFLDTTYKEILEEIQQEILVEWEGEFDIRSEFTKILHDIEAKSREVKIDALLRKSEKHGWDDGDKLLYKQLISIKA